MTAPITSAARRTVEAFSVSHAAILDGTTAANQTDIYGVRTASLAPDTGSADNTGDDVVLSTWNWFNFATLTVESGYIGFDTYALLSGSTVDVGGTATSAYVLFTPNASGGTGAGDAFDYSGPAATAFTIDGNAVNLTTDLGDLPGVVGAVDAALPGAYTVTTAGNQVRIAANAAGAGSIAVGGTNAARITGSPGYANVAGTNASELSVPLWAEDAGNQPPRPVLIRMPSRDAQGNSLALDIVLYRVQFGPMTFNGPTYKTGLTVSFTGRVVASGFDETGAAIPGKKRCGRLISRTAV
jgi:hypothetical protein